MKVSKNQKNDYIARIHAEMRLRGMTDEEINRTISKTGFNEVMEKYPEEQMHISISDAVNEIVIASALPASYYKSLKTTSEPAPIRPLCQIDYEGIVAYAKRKGVLPCDLTEQEKEMFVVERKAKKNV